MTDFIPVTTSKDGNCFYHSISSLLFGCETFTPLIRIGIVKTLLDNENLFSFLTRFYCSNKIFDSLLISASTDGDWADEFIVGAATLLISRPIFMYSISSTNRKMNYVYNLDISNENNAPLTMAFLNSHFTALLPSSDNLQPPKPKTKYFTH